MDIAGLTRRNNLRFFIIDGRSCEGKFNVIVSRPDDREIDVFVTVMIKVDKECSKRL